MGNIKRAEEEPIVVPDHLRFGRFNFHRENVIDAVARTLDLPKAAEAPAAPKVVILSGPEGIGRSYVWSAAVHRLGQQGINWRVVAFDFDGYEPDGDCTESFISFLQRSWEDEDEAAKRDKDAVLKSVTQAIGKLSNYTALGVAILHAAGKTWNAVLRHLGAKEPTGPMPRDHSREWLRQQLVELSRERPLALYCRKPKQLTTELKRDLRIELDRNGRLALAIPILPTDDPADEWPHAMREPLRVEISPLTRDEVRETFERRFHPHRCPQEMIDDLWSSSGGRQRDIAKTLGNLVLSKKSRQLQVDAEGYWFLSHDWRKGARLDDKFVEPLYKFLETLDPQTRQDLKRFLAVAALCGDFVPSRSVNRFLDLPPARAENLLDLVDAKLTSKGPLPCFDDIEYQHAGFPDQAVYHFRSPFIRHAIRGQEAFYDGMATATGLLGSLRETLPVSTRAAAEVHLSVATATGDNERRQEAVRLLSWWVGEEEAATLEELLVEKLRARTLRPESMWGVIRQFDRSLLWPPHRCLAVLNAYARQEGGPPLERAPYVHFRKSVLLTQMGRFAAALDDARLAVELLEVGDIHGRIDHESLGSSLGQVGVCLFGLGQFGEARTWFERALAAKEKGDIHGRIDHESLGSSLHLVGHCLSSMGQFEEARTWFERALAAKEKGDIHRRVDHASLGSSLHLVGHCLSSMGQFEEARTWFERALAAKEKGDIHRRVDHASLGASFRVVGDCFSHLGQFEEARTWFERALAATAKGDIHGRIDHDSLGANLHEVGVCISRLGQFEEARTWFERALAATAKGDIHGRIDHDSVGANLHEVGVCISRLGQFEEARTWFERALAATAKGDIHGRINHDSVGMSLHDVGGCLWSLGQFEEARSWLERALAAKKKGDIHGRIHQDSLGVSLDLLGDCVAHMGQFEEARTWFERAVAAKGKGDIHGRTDHDSVGTSLHAVGTCLWNLGQFEEARTWFERAVAAKEKGDIRGRTDHAYVGTSLHAVGTCLRNLGQFEEARTWFERAVAAKEKGDIHGRVDHESLRLSLEAVGACTTGP